VVIFWIRGYILDPWLYFGSVVIFCIRGYFLKPKGVREQKSDGNTVLDDYVVIIQEKQGCLWGTE
jgi:hypothetical protein